MIEGRRFEREVWDDMETHEKAHLAIAAMQRELNAAASARMDRTIVDDFNRLTFDYLNRPTIIQYSKKFMMSGGTDMMLQKVLSIYEVFAVYAENAHMPTIFTPKVKYVGAFDEDEALLRSGIYRIIDAAKKEPTTEPLDPCYITIVCRKIAETTKFRNDE